MAPKVAMSWLGNVLCCPVLNGYTKPLFEDIAVFYRYSDSPAAHPMSHSRRYCAAMIETIFQWFALAMVAGGFVSLVTIIDVALIATFHRRR